MDDDVDFIFMDATDVPIRKIHLLHHHHRPSDILTPSKSTSSPTSGSARSPKLSHGGPLVPTDDNAMSGRTTLASAFYYDLENTYQKATLAHLYRTSSLIKVASLISVPPPEVRVYLRDLASIANSTANENSCGSVLAGQGSDTDEFGDICFWLGSGPYGEGHEVNVLRALNLYDSTRQITPGQLQPSTSLPSNFKLLHMNEFTKLSVLLTKLRDKVYFCMNGGPRANGTTVHFLVGRLAEGNLSGWVGLVGIGMTLE
ncbi:hypothetical protein EI94DRAFT_1134510 [Lactarius quietus]|nr:hypothetical protein EI94DRAFT_1134510 [Lactarius quietus]